GQNGSPADFQSASGCRDYAVLRHPALADRTGHASGRLPPSVRQTGAAAVGSAAQPEPAGRKLGARLTAERTQEQLPMLKHLKIFWKAVRRLSGDDAYERYLEHYARCHAEEGG